MELNHIPHYTQSYDSGLIGLTAACAKIDMPVDVSNKHQGLTIGSTASMHLSDNAKIRKRK